MDSASLYDDDFMTWTEQQVAALRALAARPDLSNMVDWDNVIEEIETLGRSEWRGVESHLINALAHILKGYCDPGSLSRGPWSIETGNFLADAREDFRNAMRRKIDMDKVWRSAFDRASRELLTYKRRIPPGFRQLHPSPWTMFLHRRSTTTRPSVGSMNCSMNGPDRRIP